MIIRYVVLCSIMFFGVAQAAPSGALTGIEMNAKQEKQNASLTIARGAVADVSQQQSLDGLVGVTSDFEGRELPAYVVFNPSVSEEVLAELAQFQGKIKGSVQCERIRLGNSPQFPDIKLGVLAEQCTIKSLQH